MSFVTYTALIAGCLLRAIVDALLGRRRKTYEASIVIERAARRGVEDHDRA